MPTKKQTTEIVPMPVISRGRPRKYRFDLLEVGHSEVYSASYGVIYGCIRRLTRKGGGFEDRRFVLKAESPKRTRVWRKQ